MFPTCLLVGAALVAPISASPVARDVQLKKPGFIALSVEAAPVIAWNERPQPQMAGTSDGISSQLNGYKYLVNVAIGNNYQPVALHLDTNSINTWVNPNCSTIGSFINVIVDVHVSETYQCESERKYDPTRSATAKKSEQEFSLTYGSGNVTGQYFTDSFRLGEKMLKDQVFGVATETNGLASGVLGLGSATSSLQNSVLGNLKAQGLINRTAFSLNLRSAGKQGGLIFGGLDAQKYRGNLAKFASPSRGYTVPMTQVCQTFPDGNSIIHDSSPMNPRSVLIDSGAPFSNLSPDLFIAIGNLYPKSMFDTQKLRFTVPCKAPAGSIDFTFGGQEQGISKTIRVPYSDFIYKNEDEKDMKGNPLCVLGMTMDGTDSIVLGDSFSRAAYVVFDVDSKATERSIWLGEADDCGEKVVAIDGDTGVPVIEGCPGN